MSSAQLGVLLCPYAEGRSTSAGSIFAGSTLPNSPGQQRFYSLPVEQIREFQQMFIISDPDFFTIIGNRDAAWIRNCRHELEQMHHLSNNWNGYGSIPPNATAIKNTQDVLDNLYEMNLAPVSVAPSAEDGVTISFTKGNKHAVIECYNDGDIIAMTYRGENQPDIWQMGSSLLEIKEELIRIYDMLNG
ncbi:MAG: hypothetical protein WCF59_14885 [Desulfobaccales bacterium]